MDKKLKILICDDSLLVRKQLRALLETLDCEVVEAENGQEGVEQFEQERPTAVFLDIVMPITDGLTALKQMLEDNQQNARIIMLSSTGTASNLKEALKIGAHDFIQKPYSRDQIRKMIDSLRN